VGDAQGVVVVGGPVGRAHAPLGDGEGGDGVDRALVRVQAGELVGDQGVVGGLTLGGAPAMSLGRGDVAGERGGRVVEGGLGRCSRY